MGEVVDLDAIAAAKREAVKERLTFTWHGESYEVAPAELWPVEAQTALADGELANAVALILGPEQGPRFLATHPTLTDVDALLGVIGRRDGFADPGE